MAERRMFAKTIIDSDAFLDMPLSTQALYFHLCMRADDDGFVNNAKKIMRMIGATDGDAQELLRRRFLLECDGGIIVIKHWRIHNYIRMDRYKPTIYEEQKAKLTVKNDGAYTDGTPTDNQMDTDGIPDGNQMDTQVRVRDRDRDIDRDRDRGDMPTRHKYGRYDNVLLTDDDLEKLKEEFPESYDLYIEHLSEYIASTGKKYKSHLATIRSWARKDAEEEKKRKEMPF